MISVIFGRNKKRKRSEVEGLESGGNTKSKMRRLEQRGQDLMN